MTTRHHGSNGSSSDAECRVSEEERNMEDMELTELGPLLTSPEASTKPRVSPNPAKGETTAITVIVRIVGGFLFVNIMQ